MTESELVGRISSALFEGKGSLFVGSGISSGSGAPGWVEALKKLAKEKLDIEIDENDNLPLVAQYIVNHDMGNRGSLIGELRSIYHRQLRTNNYHEVLRLMNVRGIWTTNYDTLLEETFANHHKVVHINDDNLARPVPLAGIEIIKMHGCINGSPHKDIVITQQDYEDYAINRPATIQRLQHDFLTRSFLFIGYSYRDSNVSNLMTVARRLSGSATQSHIMITLPEDDDSLLPYWHSDLRRVGIEVYPIKKYAELETVLFTIAKKSVGRTVYFTGSHKRPASEPEFYSSVGRITAEIGLKKSPETVVIDGQSTGRSRLVLSAFLEALVDSNVDAMRHVHYFPNPYAANPEFADKKPLIPMLKQWRRPLMKAAQLVVTFDGGMGTEAELELAREYRCKILPVPKDKAGSALKLLDDLEIVGSITTCCPEYVAKAKALELTPAAVAACIHAMLDS